MPKRSLIDKAIAQLRWESAVLELAITTLMQQQQTKAPRRPRPVPKDVAMKVG